MTTTNIYFQLKTVDIMISLNVIDCSYNPYFEYKDGLYDRSRLHAKS